MDLSFINIPFGYLMKFCLLISGNYYLIGLFFFAVIMQAALIPLGIKQHKSQIMQRKMRPKEMAIRKKYAGRTDRATTQKMQLEVQEMYKTEGYNQLAGCLPMLIQLPIILILFAIVRQPIQYSSNSAELQADLKNGILYDNTNAIVEQYKREDLMINKGNYDDYVNELITVQKKLGYEQNDNKEIEKNDKAAKDELLLTRIIYEDYEYFDEIAKKHNVELKPSGSFDKHSEESQRAALPNFSFFGETLLGYPSIKIINLLLIIPILIFITSYYGGVISRKFMAVPAGSENNPMVNGWFMKWGMPAMSTWFAFSFPAAVGVYWIWRTVTGAVQPLILNHFYPMPVISDSDIAEAEKEFKKKKKKKVIMIEVDEDDETYTDLEIKGKPVSSGGGSKKMIVNNKIEMLSADDDDEEDDSQDSSKKK